ncbi:MAG: hypothetical protein KKH91_08215, partial [Elusimicrobia bacterium]|nr:hypothetical protein [Elusimicrobiota bacterium]
GSVMNAIPLFRLYCIVIVAFVFFLCTSISNAEQNDLTRATDLSKVVTTMNKFCQARPIEACFTKKELKGFEMAQTQWQQTKYDIVIQLRFFLA